MAGFILNDAGNRNKTQRKDKVKEMIKTDGKKPKKDQCRKNQHFNKKQPDHLSAKDVGEMGFHREFHDLDVPVCSAGDCTGLIPTPPQSDAEQESYEELYPYLPKAMNKK